MCQTMPVQIKEIRGKTATLADGRLVDVSLLKNPKVGDWVLAYANVAMKKVAAKEAEEILEMFNHGTCNT